MITKETATDIAMAYREIETTKKLLADVREAVDRRAVPDVRDAFGRQTGGLQLGVPSGDNSTRLFGLQWSLALPVMEAHLAQQEAKLAALMGKAAAELEPLILGTFSNRAEQPGER